MNNHSVHEHTRFASHHAGIVPRRPHQKAITRSITRSLLYILFRTLLLTLILENF